MTKFIEYARGVNAGEDAVAWIETTLAKKFANELRPTEEIEHILDFFASGDAPVRFKNMSYDEASVAAEKWTATLQKKSKHVHETAADTEVVLDFGDGFKIVKLIGRAAFEREGYLMRHCAGSYADRKNTEVFSLRDKNNMPHATMEKDKQVKGKGNGDIHPKYVDYVVKFLEFTGMEVRDSEMAHLGYEVVIFGAYTKTKLYRDRYAIKGTVVEYRDDVRIFTKKTELGNYFGGDIALFKGNLEISKKEKFSSKSMTEVSGSVYVREGATFTAPALAKSGSVYVREGATFIAPALTEVSGSVDMREGATFTAPVLEHKDIANISNKKNV